MVDYCGAGSMENHLFSPRDLRVLMDVNRWRFIASGFPPDVPPARSGAHDAWSRRHIDAHPHREILIVLSGAGYHGFAGRSYPTRPGTVFLFDAMEPHDLCYPPGHSPATHLWFYFTQGQCGVSMISICSARRQGGCRDLWKRSYSLAELGLSSVQALFPGKAPLAPAEARRQRCAFALAHMVASMVETGYRPQPVTRVESVQDDVIQAVIRHIRESHGRGCHLENVARIAGYSKYHFARLFQERTGMSLHQCVDEARIQAFQKMATAGLPLKIIASELGFAHPSAICRWRLRVGQ